MTGLETPEQREERIKNLLREHQDRLSIAKPAPGIDEARTPLAEQRPTKNYDNLSLKVPFDTKIDFIRAANSEKTTPSALLRKLVEDFLKTRQSHE